MLIKFKIDNDTLGTLALVFLLSDCISFKMGLRMNSDLYKYSEIEIVVELHKNS